MNLFYFENKIMEIFFILEKKQDLPINCKNKFLDYLDVENNCENIKKLMEKSKNKNDILSRISDKLIINISNFEDLQNIISEKNESYLLLISLKKYFEECNGEIKYIKESKKILDELKKQLKDINYFNYKKIEELIKNINLIDFLFILKKKKRKKI